MSLSYVVFMPFSQGNFINSNLCRPTKEITGSDLFFSFFLEGISHRTPVYIFLNGDMSEFTGISIFKQTGQWDADKVEWQ